MIIPSFLLDDSLLEDDTYHHNIRPLQRMQKMAICLISFLILVCIPIKSLFNQVIKAEGSYKNSIQTLNV